MLNRLEKGLAPAVYNQELQLIVAEDAEVQAQDPQQSLQRMPEP